MKKIVIFLILVTTALNSCNSTNDSTTPSPTFSPTMPSAECIEPKTIPAFQIGESTDPIPMLPEILPAGWVVETIMPNEFLTEILGQGIRMVVRSGQGYEEFWFLSYHKIFIYRTDLQEWRQGPYAPVGQLFVSKDGEIWILAASRSKSSSVLLRLNESKNKFEAVFDKDNILSFGTPRAIKAGNDGIFWLLIDSNDGGMTLYSFNPKTLEARSYFSGYFGSYIEIDSLGNVYVMDGQDILTKYSPSTGEALSVEIPSDSFPLGVGSSASLYIDHQDRLWVSDRIWLDTTHRNLDKIFVIVRSPIFVDRIGGSGLNAWTRPEILLESVDGLLWYKFSRGAVWFNPENGQWCLVTTYPARVIEDSQRNLWMFIDGTLYKRELSQ